MDHLCASDVEPMNVSSILEWENSFAGTGDAVEALTQLSLGYPDSQGPEDPRRSTCITSTRLSRRRPYMNTSHKGLDYNCTITIIRIVPQMGYYKL